MELIKPIKGMKILLRKSKGGGHYQYEGKICTVINVYKGYFTAQPEGTNITINIYGPKETGCTYTLDEYTAVSRKEQADYCEKRAEELIKEAEQLKKEAMNLRKFKDDEEETAHKLKQLFKNKNSEKAMAEILRELKRTDYL